MSSNRLSYDKSAYESDVRQSTGSLGYAINPVYSSNCAACFPDIPTGAPNNYTPLNEPKVDVENSLTNRTWKRDRHQPAGATQDQFYALVSKYEQAESLSACPMGTQETRYSLLSDPKSRYRGLSTDHLVFHTLPIEAQTYVPTVGDQGINSRQVAIDSYKKIMDTKDSRPKDLSNWPFSNADTGGSYAPV